MLRQMRMDFWWPGMDKDVKIFAATCWACSASTPSNTTPPMAIREVPEEVWSHVQADFKGPIGGKYYFHVMIDELSRWPEVEMVSSTSFEKLHPALERSWGLLGIPDQITHDNGPPYNSHRWRKYAREKGFKLNPCTPEHPKSNGLVERFMGVLVKTVHTAIAGGKDVYTEVQRRLLNYRNTPHPSTGRTPSEMIMLRAARTKIPSIRRGVENTMRKEAKEKDEEKKKTRKEVYDKKHRSKEVKITPGDKVLIKQEKTTIKPPFDPNPYEVTQVKGTQVTARRGGKERIRNMAKVKLLKHRPEHLRSRPQAQQGQQEEEEEDDYSWIDLSRRDVQRTEGQEHQPAGAQEQVQAEERQPERQGQGEEAVREPAVRQSERLRQKKERRQLSPRERKRRQSTAARTATPRRAEGCQERHAGCGGGRRPPGSISTPKGWRREEWSTEEGEV